MDPHLEPALEPLVELMDAERFTRERIGLAATQDIPRLSWFTYGSEPFTIGLLGLAEPSDDGILLFEYFNRAIPAFAPNEADAVGLLDHPENADEALRPYAEAGAGARRRYDVEEAVRSIDVTRLVEQFLHDTSPYGRSVFELYTAYQEAKRTCSTATLEAHVSLATELGEELIASKALSLERIDAIGTHLGRQALEHRSSSIAGAILIDIARMMGLPLIRTETGLTIPDDSHTLLETADRFSEAQNVYASAAHDAMKTTLERDPGRIAYADAYARSPSMWIYAIS